MHNVISQLRQHGSSELACQFASYIDRKESTQKPIISLLAGLLSDALAEGHVCLNLAHLATQFPEYADQLPDTIEACRQALLAGLSVGEPGDYTPLILTQDNLLYLYRYWLDERDVASQIRQRLMPVTVDLDMLKQALQKWSNQISGTDWQKVAVAVAMTRQFAVVSGGPGTGKTTIVLKILQNLLAQKADCRIGLAAPTGKAAARLQQSLSGEHNVEVKTLHRLLGITEHNDQGRFHADRPLPFDILIIDEASMIDLSLMAKLMRALSATTQLILLGDSQQLASVESGAVLANLSDAEQGEFSSQFRETFAEFGLAESVSSAALLTDSFVRLQHSYRFAENSPIGQLAKQVNRGDVPAALALLEQAMPSIWFQSDEMQQRQQLLDGYQDFIEQVEQRAEPQTIVQAFNRFRVLAALKQGPQSVSSVNRLMEKLLALRGWRTSQQFYAGRPLMITRNDYRQNLFNGDTGLVLYDEHDQLRACFCFDDTVRWVPLNRLSAHETAFAMTVHKSQGSEFDGISILLPDEISPILNRELLYTAITRARQSIAIMSQELPLRHTIQTRHYRESGLQACLRANKYSI